MDWSWNYNALRANSKEIKWSDCREIVEVPGGEEWKIRRLEESSPEYCWKYCGTSPLAQYHFEMALKQPRFLEKARRNLSEHMAAEYCRADAPSFSEDHSLTTNLTISLGEQLETSMHCYAFDAHSTSNK
ncbi:hypothetical protein TELCIR_11981 [Teladorsagia circumcincta]|uniref:Uncharacterized protein n=1 Tax=Teladorsagia circumcincta TaxID=45464 RepID=A0A2G9U7T2_TELCI|nr:hypothetical protein TELCIR_11981 [Teladorsagia circumcincta]